MCAFDEIIKWFSYYAGVTENLEHTLLKDHPITTTLHGEARGQ